MTSNAINPLPSLIRASAWDAGNQSMRDKGRKVWSQDDYNQAARTQNRLVDSCYGKGPKGRIRFGMAAALEKHRAINLHTPIKEFYALIDGNLEAQNTALENRKAKP